MAKALSAICLMTAARGGAPSGQVGEGRDPVSVAVAAKQAFSPCAEARPWGRARPFHKPE